MSSLATQLAAINANNDIIIDKKSRKKVHSVSLIYEPKVAAVQDYETIYSASLEALRELEILDSSFNIFEESLFSETSLSVDRSVQTSEQNDLLDKAIDNFLSLLAPRIHLQPAIKALEWLVRRFQIHTHNAEILLLTILPYYSTPVFLRVLDIVNLPPLFTFLKNSKTHIQNPSRDLVVRALSGDSQLCDAVQNYVSRIILSRRAYHGLLAFWSSTSIWTMISLKESGNVNEEDIVGKFLNSCSVAIGFKKDSDVQIAGYIILAVLGAQFRLSEDVKRAAFQSIVLNWSKSTMKSALSCLTQLVKLDDKSEAFEKTEWDLLCKVKGLEKEIISLCDQFDIAQFVVKWGLSIIKYSPEKIDLLKVVLSHCNLGDDGLLVILREAIVLSNDTTSDVTVKESLLKFFEFVLSKEEVAKSFKEILEGLDVTFDQLELNVQGSIETKFSFVKNVEEAGDVDVEMKDNDGDATPVKVHADQVLKAQLKSLVAPKSGSFLSTESNDDFKKFINLFTLFVQAKERREGFSNEHSKRSNKLKLMDSIADIDMDNILEKLQIPNDYQPTFLIRIWCSSSPNLARIRALELLSNIIEKSSSVDYQALIPFLLIGLVDESERIRRSAGLVIHTLADKYPSNVESVWGLDTLYGNENENSEVKWLSEKDVKTLLNDVLLPNINECFVDGDYILKRINDISSDKKFKSLHEPLLTFLSSHAISMQLPQMKINLLRILRKWGGKGSASKYLVPVFINWIEEREQWSNVCESEKVPFENLETSIVNIISSSDKVGITFLEQCIKSSFSDLSSKAGQKIVSLWRSNSFKMDVQLHLLRFLSDIAIDESIPYDSLEVLNNIDISTIHFVTLLDDCKLEREQMGGQASGSASPASVPKRRRRSSNSSREKFRGGELITFAEKHLRKITVLLELLERNKPEGTSVATLLSQLFTILGEILSLGTDSNLPALYTEQLLANCMIDAVQQLKTQRNVKIDSSVVRVDIIVSCIRSSSSPQVQNRFLLLVANLAELAPEIVLHSVMPIFTFMGANTIRQDDEFSAHVIQQTISQVIPALISNNSGTNNEDIEFLLLSFVAAFAHIPRHRRVKLFGGLVRTLKPEDSLHKLLILFGNKYSEARVKRRNADMKSYVQFGEIFVRSFTVYEQVISLKNYIHAVELTSIDSGVDNFESNITLRANLYEFLLSIFGNDDTIGGYQSLRVQILKSFNDEDDNDVMDVCSDIIEQLLKTRQDNDNTTATPLGNNLFKLLGKCLELLPVSKFVLVVKSLLETSDNDVKTHSLSLVQSKFDIELSTDKDAIKASIECIKYLTEFLLETKDTNILPLVLDDIEIIVSKFGSQLDPNDLLATLTSIVSENGLLNPDVKVFISSVNAINSLCTILGARMIGLYGKIMPVVFERFENSLSSDNDDSKFIQLSTFGLLSGLIKRIPSFLTSSIKKIFEFIFISNATSIEVRSRLMEVIRNSIENKLVISSLAVSWKYAVDKGMDVINLYLDSLDAVIDISPKKVVSNQSSILITFILEAFEVRVKHSYSNDDINRIESKLTTSAIQIVMKLNDKTFQPLFVRIVRWAMDDTSHTADSYSRKLTFFKFFVRLLTNLKSIITKYYGFILDSVTDLLDQQEKLPTALRRNILSSLALSFQNDNDEFWQSQARFDKISVSLLSQIPTIETSIAPILVKALVALCEVCSSNDHHKAINEGLISHMKSNCTSQQKIWAVKTLRGLYNKIGEDWVSFLPQLVPLVAELLEDEDEQVELEVRRHLVPAVEEVLGESLDRYLS